MKRQDIYLEVIEGSEAYKALSDWKATYEECKKTWFEFTKSIGAVQYANFMYEAPGSFAFEGDVPDGWCKPRRGLSRPKVKNKADVEAVKALPSPPNLEDLCVELGFPTRISFSTGWSTISPRICPFQLLWVKGYLILFGTDFLAALEAEKAHYPDAHFNGPCDGIPEGFSVIPKLRYDLLLAQQKFEMALHKFEMEQN